MEKDLDVTRVVFKKITFHLGTEDEFTEINAIFVDFDEGYDTLGGYAHLGQHCPIHKDFITNGFVGNHKVEDAKPAEYLGLYQELEGIGYNLEVVKI